MATRGSSATATGLTLTMISVGAGVSSGGSLVLLLSFAGVLAAAGLIFVGILVGVADNPTEPLGRSVVLAAGVSLHALVHCLRRNLALVGLLLASVAATATAAATTDRETGPVLCFCAFTLLLFGLTLVNIGVVLGEQH